MYYSYDFQDKKENYYDIESNRVTVRGINYSNNTEYTKILNYPGVLQNVYCISKDGKIYSTIDDKYITWEIKNNLPFVNLATSSQRGVSLESYFIKDLMAYNYIAKSSNYLERGYWAAYVDGNPMNCYFENIVYLGPEKKYIY